MCLLCLSLPLSTSPNLQQSSWSSGVDGTTATLSPATAASWLIIKAQPCSQLGSEPKQRPPKALGQVFADFLNDRHLCVTKWTLPLIMLSAFLYQGSYFSPTEIMSEQKKNQKNCLHSVFNFCKKSCCSAWIAPLIPNSVHSMMKTSMFFPFIQEENLMECVMFCFVFLSFWITGFALCSLPARWILLLSFK